MNLIDRLCVFIWTRFYLGKKKDPYCCHIRCFRRAEYEIWSPPDPYDITQSCVKHVGSLLEDNENPLSVYPIYRR